MLEWLAMPFVALVLIAMSALIHRFETGRHPRANTYVYVVAITGFLLAVTPLALFPHDREPTLLGALVGMGVSNAFFFHRNSPRNCAPARKALD